MKLKGILITGIICFIFLLVLFVGKFYDKNYVTANNYYEVYLKGNSIGLISSSNDLYDLINKEQESIRNEYNVSNVYPPSDFSLVKKNTYNDKLTSVNDIYKMIEKEDDFTIPGYKVTISLKDHKDIVINVLDRKVFEEALYKYVYAFVDENDYNAYLNGTQEEIKEVGSIIEKMYFKESISIQEGLVSVNEKIYTNVAELSQFLLFGENAKMQEYQVKLGDTLESIAEANKLNVQELLISNPEYRDENTILAVGDKLNVTILNPMLNLIEEIHKVEDVEATMENKIVYDNTKSPSYSEVTTPGVRGITRLTEQYQVVNGEANSEVIVTNRTTIREAVTQVTTKGSKSYYSSSNISGKYVDTGLEWGWPTNQPYLITSGFAWRWGKHHDGIDISGTGEGSPIYAAGNGVVVSAGSGGQAGWEAGINVIIEHPNNYYTIYAHLKSTRVSVGQKVKKGQVIGTMGHTGYATGTHLHFGASVGNPYRGSYSFFNPLKLYS